MKMRKHILAFFLPALAAQAQYSGKVGGAEKKTVLRATAVYEYTGALAKPNASRLVPVVVWDGVQYQPGGLYLARPEPLAIAPGTQYELQKGGIPAGLFNVSSAAKLTEGGWVGLGRFQSEAPPPPIAKLKPSKKLPVLTGGSGKGKAGQDTPAGTEDRPTLHRKADSGSTTAPSTPAPSASDNGPTLHRRDTPDSGTSQGDPNQPTLHRKDTSESGTSAEPDPDRPTLHSSGTSAAGAAPDPDRPTLHRHADSTAATVTAPDPDRPHLRYGASEDDNARVQPALLEDKASAGVTSPGATALGTIADAVAVSDTDTGEPHPYAYAWPTPQAQADAQTAMHALALRALASAAQATFGPAAKSDAALRQAAAAAQAGFGPGARSGTRSGTKGTAIRKRADTAPPATDPFQDPQMTALELSYGGGATYIYSAHTAAEGPARRYVTVIAQPDFYGRPQVVFSQTTRGELLAETPALRLIDAVDADGDHRAELLFSRETSATLESPASARQFALYSVVGGRAKLLYASEAGSSAGQ